MPRRKITRAWFLHSSSAAEPSHLSLYNRPHFFMHDLQTFQSITAVLPFQSVREASVVPIEPRPYPGPALPEYKVDDLVAKVSSAEWWLGNVIHQEILISCQDKSHNSWMSLEFFPLWWRTGFWIQTSLGLWFRFFATNGFLSFGSFLTTKRHTLDKQWEALSGKQLVHQRECLIYQDQQTMTSPEK